MSTAIKEDSISLNGARVLVLGRSEAVLEAVLGELGPLGIDARGTAEPEKAAERYDARDYDLIALGRGLLGEAGQSLKAQFRERNADVRFLDTYAPFAVYEIVTALECSYPPSVDLEPYLARIGSEGPIAPTLETLNELHERHPDAIPFEAIDVLLERGVNIAPDAVEDKLVHGRRGGYCFEHNGLFKRVLEAIGFHVEGLSARVRWNAAPGTAPQPYSHMALRVVVDNVPWLVDVGFGGCVLTTPLRMDTIEPQATSHETFRLIPFGPGMLLQMWIDEQWKPVYELSGEPRLEGDYEVANWYTAEHPDSHFRKNLMVARTSTEARYTLMNGRYTVRYSDGRTHREVLEADGIERVLADTFQLPVQPDWRPMIERAALLTER